MASMTRSHPEHVSLRTGGQATLQSLWVFPYQEGAAAPEHVFSSLGSAETVSVSALDLGMSGTRAGQACLVPLGPDCFLEEFCLGVPLATHRAVCMRWGMLAGLENKWENPLFCIVYTNRIP